MPSWLRLIDGALAMAVALAGTLMPRWAVITGGRPGASRPSGTGSERRAGSSPLHIVGRETDPHAPSVNGAFAIPAAPMGAASQWARLAGVVERAADATRRASDLQSAAAIQLDAAEFALAEVLADCRAVMSSPPARRPSVGQTLPVALAA